MGLFSYLHVCFFSPSNSLCFIATHFSPFVRQKCRVVKGNWFPFSFQSRKYAQLHPTVFDSSFIILSGQLNYSLALSNTTMQGICVLIGEVGWNRSVSLIERKLNKNEWINWWWLVFNEAVGNLLFTVASCSLR